MHEKETIQGSNVTKCIAELIEAETPLNLHIPVHDLQCTVHIHRYDDQAHPACFQIRFSQNRPLPDDLTGKETTLIFQYMGTDRVVYRFVSKCANLDENDMWVDLPNEIERIQQRASFRIKAPAGTRLVGKATPAFSLQVSNISIGGALVSEYPQVHRQTRQPLFDVGDTPTGVSLRIPFIGKTACIEIERIHVVRRHISRTGKRVTYAVSFDRIAPTQEQALVKAVYDIQRRYLKNRMKLI